MTYKCDTCDYEGHHYGDALIHASAHWPKAAVITAAPTRPVRKLPTAEGNFNRLQYQWGWRRS